MPKMTMTMPPLNLEASASYQEAEQPSLPLDQDQGLLSNSGRSSATSSHSRLPIPKLSVPQKLTLSAEAMDTMGSATSRGAVLSPSDYAATTAASSVSSASASSAAGGKRGFPFASTELMSPSAHHDHDGVADAQAQPQPQAEAKKKPRLFIASKEENVDHDDDNDAVSRQWSWQAIRVYDDEDLDNISTPP